MSLGERLILWFCQAYPVLKSRVKRANCLSSLLSLHTLNLLYSPTFTPNPHSQVQITQASPWLWLPMKTWSPRVGVYPGSAQQESRLSHFRSCWGEAGRQAA